MWVVDAFEVVVTAFDANFELGNNVAITGNTKDAFGFGASESEDAVGEEG